MRKIKIKKDLHRIHQILNELVQTLDEGDYWMEINEDQEAEVVEVDSLDFDIDDDYPTRLHFALICEYCGRTRESTREPCINCV